MWLSRIAACRRKQLKSEQLKISDCNFLLVNSMGKKLPIMTGLTCKKRLCTELVRKTIQRLFLSTSRREVCLTPV